MTVLNIGYGYGSSRGLFLFPPDIDDAEEFAYYIADKQADFIQLMRLSGEHSVFPYFIESEVKPIFIYGASINNLSEVDITMLTEEEYGERLRNLTEKICVECTHCREYRVGEDPRKHWWTMCLDGTCSDFEPIEEKEERKEQEHI